MMRKVAAVLLLVALLGGGAVWFGMDGRVSTINFATGFVSALVVLGASAFGYWQMVAGSAGSAPHHPLPDIVEQMDDRYDLWDEEGAAETDDAKSLLKAEKTRLKKRRRDFKTVLKTARPAISVYRLLAYLLLAAGVYWLIREEMFAPVPYLIGAGLAPLAVAATLYLSRE
ncbi:hypothetical protein [Hydrogenimonas urashimensis]|uniref:hypothetical protein n=1 Tax=Hydrogenimonas urashimensis TaxID=2740515 RepID=UPI001914EF38|nr:hypothetical protein [Hydrogenimonas urashimensis]